MPDTRSEVDAILEAWARWSVTALSGLGWPEMSIIGRIMKYGTRGAAQRAGVPIVEENTLCELVDRLLQQLSRVERRTVIRHYMWHETQAVSARALGLNHEAFRQVLSRSRQKLAKMLQEEAGLSQMVM